MSQAGTIDWDEEALEDMLNGPEGLVAEFLVDLSTQAALVATAVVHIRPGTPSSATTGRRSNARAPGFTKSRITPHIGYNTSGRLFGGVNAPADPSIFLEKPARQMNRTYPFLTTGLWSLEGTF